MIIALLVPGITAVAPPARSAERGAATSPALTAKTRSVRVGDHRMGYRSFGHGPPVVIIEGYGVTIDHWDPRMLDRLARHHRVVVFDNRGIGRSTGSVDGLTIRTMADDAVGLIRALRVRRPTVIGHSMGAIIAQEVGLDHPRALARLVLAAPQPGGAGQVSPAPEPIQRLAPPYDSFDILDLLFSTPSAGRSYKRSVLRRGTLERVPEPVQSAQLVASAAWLTSPAESAWDRLPSLRLPTLVTTGTDDPLVPPGNAVRIARRIPGARLVRFRKLRHAFLMEDAGGFVRAVDRFAR